ncbi:MAG TPA: DUF5723 family protein [Saprospiraceae bacterium]|nr:DUF5723 family protein [Saprospiraceae bacterium]
MKSKAFLILIGIMCTVGYISAQSPQYNILDDSTGSGFDLLTDILPQTHIRLITGHYSATVYHSAFSYKDLVSSESENLINISSATSFNKLKDQNNFLFETELKTLGIGIRFGKIGVGFQHSITSYNNLVYPKDLYGLLFLGNAQYIGKTVNIGPQLNSSLYNSFGFGIGVDLDKFKIAARINLLTGIAGAQTDNKDISLYTNPEYYQLTLTTDYSINTSDLINLDSLKTQNILAKLDDYKTKDFFTSNFGVTADLAMHLSLNEKISMGLGVRRLGYLNFNKNATLYSTHKVIQYDGVDISDFIYKDSVSIQGLLDSFSDLIKFDKTAQSFKVKLYPELEYYAKYRLNNLFSIYGGVNFSPTPENAYWSASAGGALQLFKSLTFGLNYIYLPGANFNIGTHLRLKLWKIDFQAGSDNILAVFNPENYNFTTGYVGLRWNL